MAAKFTEEQLNSADRSLLIQMILNLQDQSEELTREIHELNEKMQLMMEQLILAKKNRFGRSSEKMEDPDQICFKEVDGNIVFFNESEAVSDPEIPEPEDLDSKKKHGKKRSGKKEEDLSGLPVNVINHYLSEEELIREFGENGWNQLPDTVARRYHFVPAMVEVDEHHAGVYVDKKDKSHVVRAPYPQPLLRGSLVSPSLAAAIMNGKYVNAVPLYRLEKEFERNGLCIPRQNMANWMIRLDEEYLGLFYEYLHKLLYEYHVIQADETTVKVNHDGRPAGSTSYMWVYRSGFMYPEKQIVLYEYQKTRNTSHPLKFLKNYKGICVTDGYSVYHSIEKKLDDLQIAGCWVHARRRFSEALETIKDKEKRKTTVGYLVMKQIQAIYREEGKLKDLDSKDRLNQRQVVIKPLVDALFVYLKKEEPEIQAKGKMRQAFTYILNKEKYLRVFLDDGDVPMDNNASERAIRGFTIGRKNWQMIDTIKGAQSSAVIYSIAETAKANKLKPYDYFEYLLTEIPKHMEDHDLSFLEDLLPWLQSLPEHIRKPK